MAAEIGVSVAGSVGGETAKGAMAVISKQFGYLINYNRNIEVLEERAQELDEKKNHVKKFVDHAVNNLQDIDPAVGRWQKKVDAVISEEFRGFLHHGNNTSSLNPISRYSLGRKAFKKVKKVEVLLEQVRDFNLPTTIPAPPLTMGSSYSLKDIKDVESRLSIMNQVVEALKDDEISMIGICGMGGVGKTTMVKRIVKMVESQNLFQKATMAVVSQDQNLMKIQDEIASWLGLKLGDDGTLEVRAGKLRERLLKKSERRILIILDDIWKRLDLEEIGIPFGSENIKACKIILTSRSVDVCDQMRSQRIFGVPVLSKEEARCLFREMAGDSVNRPDIQPIAKEVADECGGLPLAIVTVARALEGKSWTIWDDALRQLRQSKPTNISGMQTDVYSRIYLSYNCLESAEAKSCFLLCCLFPEDYNIPIETLFRYGMGLGLFGEFDNLHQARISAYSLIDKLKRLFLLLDGDANMNDHVKMHDVVRDAALLLASKREECFWLQQETHEGCTSVSLFCKEIKDHLESTKRALLHLARDNRRYMGQHILTENFLTGMESLRVLSLDIPSLPKSINVLNNLQTLRLSGNEFEEAFRIGSLVSLEILEISSICLQNFPVEIGVLRNLRLLDMRRCRFVTNIPPGVLSSICNLEELYMPRLFQNTQTDGNTSLMRELESLHLNALKIVVPNSSILPKQPVFKRLARFDIFISRVSCGRHETNVFPSGNKLRLEGDIKDVIDSGIHSLLEKTQGLTLANINIKNVLHELGEEGFSWLNKLSVENCLQLECVADATEQIPNVAFPLLENLVLSNLPNLKEIWHGQLPKVETREWSLNVTAKHPQVPVQSPPFGNLRELHVSNCHKLTYVFTLSMARGLKQLQYIQLHDCQEMEAVSCQKEEQDEKTTSAEIQFCRLTHISLSGLPKLIGFSYSQVPIDHPAAELLPDQQSNGESAMKPSLNHQEPNPNPPEMGKMAQIKDAQIQVEEYSSDLRIGSTTILTSTLFTSCSPQICSLKILQVIACHFLAAVFSHSVAERLALLEELEVTECDNMEYIIVREAAGENDGGIGNIVFPRLKKLHLENLPQLVAFSSESEGFTAVQFPSLKKLIVSYLPVQTLGSIIAEPRTTMNTSIGHDSTIHEGNSEVLKTDTTVRRSKEQRWSLRNLLPCNCIKMKRSRAAVLDAPMMNVNHNSQLHEGEGSSKPQMERLACDKEVAPYNKTGFLDELRDLAVDSCENLLNVVPRNLMQSLQKLEKLDVQFCDSLVEIFEYEAPDMDPENALTFSQLRWITLKYLKSLRKIFNNPKTVIAFQNLLELYITDCASLKNIFTIASARDLLQLQELSVIDCEMLEEIVIEEDEEQEGRTDKMKLFPQLRSMKFVRLSKLSRFYNGIHTIELPSLTQVYFERCDGMVIFPNDVQSHQVYNL